jgi:hypothetical protein
MDALLSSDRLVTADSAARRSGSATVWGFPHASTQDEATPASSASSWTAVSIDRSVME